MGDGNEDTKSIIILNRIVTWTDQGLEYEADQRHAEIIIKEVGLTENCRTHETPSSKPDKKDIKEEKGFKGVKGTEATRFRAFTARANFLAQDRGDISFAVRN